MSELGMLAGFRRETVEAVRVAPDAMALAEARSGAADVTFKDGRDVVTATDVAVEDAVRSMLTAALPYTVFGEERGGSTDAATYWLVDPICGTRNYASGLSLYCINLALVEDGEVTVGVVADPSTGEVLLAERGHGAWGLKGRELRRLKATGDSRVLVIEDGKSKGATREHIARYIAEAIRRDRWDFRSFGTSLVSPYLAAGRVVAYVVAYIGEVHAAAGAILVEEAGGVMTDFAGERWSLQSDSLIASASRELHAELLEIARTTA